jgi:serine/threonine-protein kinase HipA
VTSERQAYVVVQLPGTFGTVPAALLKVEKRPDGTFVGRFRYGDRYLERKDAIAFDPFGLPLGNTVHEFTKLKGIPGAVRDAGPDAWGRRVIEHKLQRTPGDLEEIDYLLNGPQDGAGNLSFSRNVELPATKRRYNRTHQLADLIAAVEAIEEGKRVPAHILEQLEPGTSMGGARPKATIEDGNRLWLGKFPEKGNRCNLQRVEYATLELARRCGITACNARLQAVAAQDVLMVERFDRQRTHPARLRRQPPGPGPLVLSVACGSTAPLVGEARRRSHRAIPAHRLQRGRHQQRRPSPQPCGASHRARMAPHAGV